MSLKSRERYRSRRLGRFDFPIRVGVGHRKWTYHKIFGKAEDASSDKAKAYAGLTDNEMKLIFGPDGKPKKDVAEKTFMQKAANFFKEFGAAITGKPEFEEKAKCVDCAKSGSHVCPHREHSRLLDHDLR